MLVLERALAHVNLCEQDHADDVVGTVGIVIASQYPALEPKLLGVQASLARSHDNQRAVILARQARLLLSKRASQPADPATECELAHSLALAGHIDDALSRLTPLILSPLDPRLTYTNYRAAEIAAGYYLFKGELASAISLLRHQIDYCRTVDNRCVLSCLLNNMAYAYLLTGDFDESESLARSSLVEAIVTGRKFSYVAASLTLSRILALKVNVSGALEIALRAVEDARQTDDQYFVQYALQNLADCLRETGDLAKAYIYARQADEPALRRDVSHDRATAKVVLGQVVCDASQVANGIGELESAVRLFEECKAAAELIEAQAILAGRLWAYGECEPAAALLVTATESGAERRLGSLVARHAHLAPELFAATAEQHQELKVLRQFRRSGSPVRWQITVICDSP